MGNVDFRYGHARYMITLLFSSFLQEGHMGSLRSSDFSFGVLSTAVDRDGDEELSNENWTDTRFFNLAKNKLRMLLGKNVECKILITR